jgi:hypothetical protein
VSFLVQLAGWANAAEIRGLERFLCCFSPVRSGALLSLIKLLLFVSGTVPANWSLTLQKLILLIGIQANASIFAQQKTRALFGSIAPKARPAFYFIH